MSDLEQRVETLERIIVAMCSSQQFAICLDEHGRPKMFTETPGSSLPRSIVVNPK